MPADKPVDFPLPEGETMPEGGFGGRGGTRREGMNGEKPEDFDGKMPTMPEGETMPEGGFGGRGQSSIIGGTGEASTDFYMSDKVNAFSGVTAVTE